MKYAVVIEAGPTSFGAHVPDLPGCMAVGETKSEVLELIREAIELHLQSLQEQGEKIPQPSSIEFVNVAAESARLPI
jgi:predicted RNase H-like HicB family nuclease